MPLTFNQTESGTIATLSGEFTIGTLEDLKAPMLEMLEHFNLQLNLSQVTEFDGAGLQLLKIVLTEATRRNRPIVLEHVNAHMSECMQLLGFEVAVADPEETQHGSL